MGAFITPYDYAEAVDVSYATACRRLAGLPTDTPGKRRFSVVDILPTLRATERNTVPRILAAAQRIDCLFQGDTVAPRSRRLEAWLRSPERSRLEGLRNRLAPALASLQSGDLLLFYERLRLAILLHNDVLWHVLGKAPPPKNFDRFAMAFAIANAREENLEIEHA